MVLVAGQYEAGGLGRASAHGDVAADSQGGGLVGVEDLGEGFHQQRQRVVGR